MSKLFSYNAFATLGVDTRSSHKEVVKQYKKIIKFIQNDDEFDYDYDLGSINKVSRTEASVNNAVQRLSSPIKRIKEYFFWFEIENDEDENNLKLLKGSKFDEALDNWKERAKKSHTAKRNLAIASSILLNHTGYKKYAKYSIDSWKDILESDKFWDHFEKVYELNDDIGTSKIALNDFRDKVLNYLSDFYTDVSRNKKDNSIYAAFNSAFGVKGQKMQDEVLGPIFEQINIASGKLGKLNASQDNVLSQQEKVTIKKLSKRIQDSFQEITELGLYDDTQSKIMRDNAAEAINIVAIDLFNNLSEYTRALNLLKIAKSFAIGPKVVSQINKNYDYINEVLLQGKITDPINSLISKEQYEEALQLLNEEQSNEKHDKNLQTYFRERIQWCVALVAKRYYKENMQLFNSGKFAESRQGFIDLNSFIMSYIDDYNFDKKSLDNMLAEINALTSDSKSLDYANIDNYRKQILDSASETFKGQFEEFILIYLIDCGIYSNLSLHIPKLRRKKTVKKVIWYSVIGIISILIWVASGSNSDTPSTGSNTNSSSTTTSSKKATHDACIAQYNSLKGQLDTIEGQMDAYDKANNIDAYNNLVPQQNSLVQQVNNKAAECNNIR